jgi:hypothetical protein
MGFIEEELFHDKSRIVLVYEKRTLDFIGMES